MILHRKAPGISHLAGLYLHILFPDRENIQLFRVGFCNLFDVVVTDVQFRHQFSVEVEHLVVSKNHRGTEIKDASVGKGMENQLDSYPIQVSY